MRGADLSGVPGATEEASESLPDLRAVGEAAARGASTLFPPVGHFHGPDQELVAPFLKGLEEPRCSEALLGVLGRAPACSKAGVRRRGLRMLEVALWQ